MTNASFWDKAAPKYAKDPISDPAGYALTRDRIAEILQPHHRVLEMGCGTGSTALELARGVDRYIGTDVSPKMIEIARSKLTPESPAHLSFEVQDAGTPPAPSNDVILALNLMHLLPNLEEVLRQIHEALPPGGVFIAKTGLLRDGPWILPKVIPLMRLVGKAPYVRSLSAAELLALLEHAGFTVTEQLVQDGMVPRLFSVAMKP